jgi:lysophospholipase L1-like esterase
LTVNLRLLFLPIVAAALCGLLPLRADETTAHKRPDPARFAGEIAKFDKADAETPPPQDGIVFTGSSSVRFWKVTEAFPDLPVLNRGFGGSVANDLVVYADKVAVRYHPKVLVVYTGSNDLHAKLTPAEAFADYTKFLQLAHEKLPQTKVIVCSVKVAPVRTVEIPLVKQLNSLLEPWCKQQPWITWIESTQYLIGEDGQPIDKLFRSTDHLHLNDEGYAKWNAIVSPVLHHVWAEANGTGTK